MADNTPVNGQITDSVLETHAPVLGYAHQDKWIDVISVDWGATRSTTTRSGKRLRQPRMRAGTVTITKNSYSMSTVVIVDSNYGGARGTYLKYALENVRVTSLTTSGSGANMTETMTLKYGKIRLIPARARIKWQ